MGRKAWLILALAWGAPAAAAPHLPALGAAQTGVSASGVSSGGFMALQYGVAFSSSVAGVGVVAGGPYNCARVTFGWVIGCMKGSPSGAAAFAAAQAFARSGDIDPVQNLRSQRVYIFSGLEDPLVSPSVVEAVQAFFRAAGTPPSRIQYVNTFHAGHGFLSANFGGRCAETEPPYVNTCLVGAARYDQPGAILKQIYGALQPRTASLPAAPQPFDQTEFASNFSGLADTGYVYVPSACRTRPGCRVHVVFHGCEQNADEVGDAVYGRMGFNEWAERNRIIVLYPQTRPVLLLNPKACWDWWGYTAWRFQTRTAPQLKAVRAMVRRLAEHPR